MLTVNQLDEMSQIELDKTNKNGLVDIRSIQIETGLAPEQRMIHYLEQVKNPYNFLCGGAAVRVRFEPEGAELKSKLQHYFISLKRI